MIDRMRFFVNYLLDSSQSFVLVLEIKKTYLSAKTEGMYA